MGKASSAKKVARAAGIGGGRTSRGRRPWMYYGAILLVVVLGVVGTWQSRNHRLAQINAAGTGSPPTVGSTENAAFAVYACGKFLPPIKATKDPVGLTTTGDGIIDIHPTTKAAAGKNATLGLFASSIGMTLNASEVQVPGGHLYVAGAKCNGKASYVFVRHFLYVGDTVGTLETKDPQHIHLDNGSLYTIAFVPRSDTGKIPAPPASVVQALSTLETAQQSTTTLPVTPSTTAPSPTTTTKAPTTTAPAKTTTTK